MRKKNENAITDILKLIAPGTPIRDGLENILRVKRFLIFLISLLLLIVIQMFMKHPLFYLP